MWEDGIIYPAQCLVVYYGRHNYEGVFFMFNLSVGECLYMMFYVAGIRFEREDPECKLPRSAFVLFTLPVANTRKRGKKFLFKVVLSLTFVS
jgi:hypothetical protein